MPKVNVNAYMDEFEEAFGSCVIEAKRAYERGNGEMAAFLEGAAVALDLFPNCKKPGEFGTIVAVEFRMRNGEIDG